MRFTRCFAICVVSLVFFVCIPASSSADISPEKEQAIRKLMEMIGATEIGSQVSQQLLGQLHLEYPLVPESLWSEFTEFLDPAELTGLAIPIYDRHFTMEELQALIDFYTTPIGREVVKKLPIVAQESNAISQQWGDSKAFEIIDLLAKQGYYRQ